MKILLTDNWAGSDLDDMEFYRLYRGKILEVEVATHEKDGIVFTGKAKADSKMLRNSDGTHSEGVWYRKATPLDIVKARLDKP